MLLRRFTKHVTDQNWFAVCLDVIVVVLGIFLGMQVTEWNEDRKLLIEEKGYLKRIYTDHLVSLNESIERANGHKKRSIDVLSLLNYLEGDRKDLPSDDALQNALCRWYAPAGAGSQNFAFEELVASGRLELLNDEKLRLLLQKSQSVNVTANFNFQMLSEPVQAKASLLESYIQWEPIISGDLTVHTDSDNGTICIFELDALKASQQAKSIIAQLYRSQLIYQTFRQEQVEGIRAVLDYMNDNIPH